MITYGGGMGGRRSSGEMGGGRKGGCGRVVVAGVQGERKWVVEMEGEGGSRCTVG